MIGFGISALTPCWGCIEVRPWNPDQALRGQLHITLLHLGIDIRAGKPVQKNREFSIPESPLMSVSIELTKYVEDVLLCKILMKLGGCVQQEIIAANATEDIW